MTPHTFALWREAQARLAVLQRYADAPDTRQGERAWRAYWDAYVAWDHARHRDALRRAREQREENRPDV